MKAWLGQPVRRGTVILVLLLGLLLLGGLVAIALTAGRDVVREQIVYEAIEERPSRAADAIRPELAPRFEELEKRISEAKGFSDQELEELRQEIGVQSDDIIQALEQNPGRAATSIESGLDPSPQEIQTELNALCRELRAGGQGAPSVSC